MRHLIVLYELVSKTCRFNTIIDQIADVGKSKIIQEDHHLYLPRETNLAILPCRYLFML